MILAALVVALISIVSLVLHILYIPPIADKGICRNDFKLNDIIITKNNIFNSIEVEDGECYFSDDYYEASRRFKELAKEAGATEIKSLQVVKDLYTDVAIFEGTGSKRSNYFIHESGTHGPESYVGSASQLLALHYLKSNNIYNNVDDSDLPTIVFIHALNPYGFLTHRRVNEDSLDQNRNLLSSEEEWNYVRSRDRDYAGHVTLGAYINPVSMLSSYRYLNEIERLVKGLIYKYIYGAVALKRALVSGNYHDPTGYAFGGTKWSQSAINLRTLLLDELNIPNNAERLVFIDVHTGLGPQSVDTLIAADDTDESLLESVFPTEYNNDIVIGGYKTKLKVTETNNNDIGQKDATAEAVSAGYNLVHGTITTHFCPQSLVSHLATNNKLCVTQEIGTYNEVIVGMSLLAENYAFHHGTEEDKAYYADRLKQVFYVESKEWKRRTMHRTMKVFLQAVDYLSQ